MVKRATKRKREPRTAEEMVNEKSLKRLQEILRKTPWDLDEAKKLMWDAELPEMTTEELREWGEDVEKARQRLWLEFRWAQVKGELLGRMYQLKSWKEDK